MAFPKIISTSKIPNNLQGKITVVTSVIIFVFVGIFVFLEYRQDKAILYERMVLHIRENAYSIRSGIENVGNPGQVHKVLEEFARNTSTDSHSHEHSHDEPDNIPHQVHMINRAKMITASTNPQFIHTHIDQALGHHGAGLRRILKGELDYSLETMEHVGMKVMAISLPIRREGKIVGAIHYAEPYSKYLEMIHLSLLRQTGMGLFLIISLSLFVNFSLNRLVIKPIKDLSNAMDDIRVGGEAEQIDVSSKDEIGLLARTFNQMSSVLKDREDEVKRYTTSLENMVEERTEKLKDSHAQLLQSEKLASMGKLASYLAHEINNPIGIIVSRAECILMDSKEEDYPETLMKDIEVIKKHSHRIGTITNSMLSFTRKASVEFNATDINKVIDDLLLFLEKQFSNSKIRVRKEMDYTIPSITGNANQLQQVFLNIFNNAKDAMPEGGEILIRTEATGNGRIKATVSDSGDGIPQEDLENIFDPFYTTKEEGKGTGLGLSVTSGIIEEHDGEISVESKEGEGTTFVISLPVNSII